MTKSRVRKLGSHCTTKTYHNRYMFAVPGLPIFLTRDLVTLNNILSISHRPRPLAVGAQTKCRKHGLSSRSTLYWNTNESFGSFWSNEPKWAFDPQLSRFFLINFIWGGSLLLHYWQRGFPWYLSNEYLLLRLLITCLLLLLNWLLISLLYLTTSAALWLIIIATDLALILVLWMLAKCLFTKSKKFSFGLVRNYCRDELLYNHE